MSSEDESSRDAAQQRLSINLPPTGAADGAAAQQQPELSNPQLLAGGGAASFVPIIRVADASLISTAVPPIGRDPDSHNRDVTANLHAVNQALMSSGSVLPRILTAPTDSAGLAGLPLGPPAGSVRSTASDDNPPPSSAGPGRIAGPGVSEIKSNRLQR